MRKWASSLLILLSLVLAQLLPSSAQAQFGGCLPGFCGVRIGDCAEATAFFARAPGLDNAHAKAYDDLICGLVTDGVWSKFDVLHVYATQNQTIALLNLVSANYKGVGGFLPVFTVDRGFTGADGNHTIFVDTQFNPVTAVSPLFTRDDAHVSAWNVINVDSTNPIIGLSDVPSLHITTLYPEFTSSGTLYCVNCNGTISPVATADSTGFYLADRTSSTSLLGYKNGVNEFTDNANSSTPLVNGEIYVCSGNNITSTPSGSPYQTAMSSIGSSLTPTDVTNFYTRLRTYMTTVGVP